MNDILVSINAWMGFLICLLFATKAWEKKRHEAFFVWLALAVFALVVVAKGVRMALR